MTDFEDALTHLTGASPQENIAAIKALVVDQFHSTDQRAQIDVTDHFNHSFVPDLILSWPGSSEKRNVFLRTAIDFQELRRDLDVLGRDHPILLPLTRIEDSDDSDAQRDVQDASQESQTLITDPAGLEAFEAEAVEAPVVTILSHAVLQGGRGLVGAAHAQRVSDQVNRGFIGAQSADFERTGAAVQTAEGLLDSHRASQVNRLLHAVWVGSGAPGSSFPTALGSTGLLDAESLRFVLDLPEFEDAGFWGRLGSSLTIERLCQLGEFGSTPNLQRLLRGNLYRLTAKACRVYETDIASPMSWFVTSNCLALRVDSTTALFAPRSVSDLPPERDRGNGIPLGALQSRADTVSSQIAEVRFSDGEKSVVYSADDRTDVSRDPALTRLDTVLANGRIAVVRVSGPNHPDILCNFRSGTGVGNGPARFELSDLAQVAVPLLTAMSDAARNLMQQVFSERSMRSTEEHVSNGGRGSPDPLEDS